jgi:hypothetical protein
MGAQQAASARIYVDTSKQVGDKDHLKVFADQEVAEPGSRRTSQRALLSNTT